ncbi:hypothetical protein THERMOT_1892, partial [Bathymodiolus thermophilus thioautotrophic gill symbiont]|uniref:hypothetical protein n=1 Tax=Bathymodiolus thermophilus thioautotrophic gill symbiont TaxID=2360 RepID=UPI00192CADB2
MKTTQLKASQMTVQATVKKNHKEIDSAGKNTQQAQEQVDTTHLPNTKDFNSKDPYSIAEKTDDNLGQVAHYFNDKQFISSTIDTSIDQGSSKVDMLTINNNAAPAIEVTTDNIATTITGIFSAGKYINGNVNSVKVYKADGSGTLISTTTLDDNGQITITLTGTNANYTGAVYIKLTKTGISHQDELNGTEAL